MKKVKQKKVTEKNLRVNDIIYNGSGLFTNLIQFSTDCIFRSSVSLPNTSSILLPLLSTGINPSLCLRTVQKKVTEKNLRVNDIIYNQENASELFEVEALQDGIGVMISLTHHEIGSSTLFISTSLFLMFSGNASSASINTLKFFVFISFFLLATISSPVANTQVSPHLRNALDRLEKPIDSSKPTGKLRRLFSKIKYKIQEKMK
jgi:hypothetical protein